MENKEEATGTNFYKPVFIQSVKEEVPGFKTFVLQGDIEYVAGQYLTLVHLGKFEEVRRSYSFMSAPALGEPMCIGVKKIDNGFFSRRLVESAKVGDRLLTIGAGGRFTLPQSLEGISQVFMLAAGSGITPVFSLIKTVLHCHPSVKVTLIYSNATPEKTVFLHQLEALQLQIANRFNIEYLFSNNPDLGRAHLYRDLLEAFLDTYITVPFEQVLFYCCGPESYMRLCSYVLQEAKVPHDHIKKENFTIERTSPPRAAPPDKEAHNISLQIGAQQYQFVAQYPDTILQAAKKSGIQMPYSCEVGRCGNCLARCTKGSVWHSYNEVLTDGELAAGLVLTCVAHPFGGDAELVIE